MNFIIWQWELGLFIFIFYNISVISWQSIWLKKNNHPAESQLIFFITYSYIKYIRIKFNFLLFILFFPYRSAVQKTLGPSSYGSWIYNYLCNQCLSPLRLWVRIPFMPSWQDVLDTTLCDKSFVSNFRQWISSRTPVSATI